MLDVLGSLLANTIHSVSLCALRDYILASTSNVGILCALAIAILEWVKSDSFDHFSWNKNTTNVVAAWASMNVSCCMAWDNDGKARQLMATPKDSYSGTPQYEHPEMQKNPSIFRTSLKSGHLFNWMVPKLKCCVWLYVEKGLLACLTSEQAKDQAAL